MLRISLAALAGLTLCTSAFAQTVPPRGTAGTLDVAAWNIEHFGGEGGPDGAGAEELQQRNAEEVLRDADIDLWALEEIKSATAFDEMLSRLADQGLAGQMGPSVSNSPFFDQRLAFVWDPAVVEMIYIREVPESLLTPSNFGGRQPLEMKARLSLPGAEAFTVYFVALHAKCCSDSDSYDQREAGATQLKAYTDMLVAQGIDVVVLGDYNDRLDQSITPGRPSPYRPFLTDSDTYRFATEALDVANTPTFCGNSACSSGSPIDHLMFSSGLFDRYVEGSGDRYIELVGSIPSYTSTTSDHLPVLARFAAVPVAAETVSAGTFDLRVAPSPFGASTTVHLALPEAARLRAELYDALGRRVRAWDEGERAAGVHRVRVSGDGLAPGVYTLRLIAGGRQATQRLARR